MNDGFKGDTSLKPENSEQSLDSFIRDTAEALKKIRIDDLISGFPDSVTTRPQEKTVAEFIMVQQARLIAEASAQPVEIFKRNTKNVKYAESDANVIQQGDFLHGMPIEHFAKAKFGILAPEFYGGKTKSASGILCSVYLSEVTQTENGDTPKQTMQKTHTKEYGMTSGTVTVVFDADSKIQKNLRSGTVHSGRENSVARVLPVGAALTDIKACIVNNPEDIQKMKDIATSLPVFIPLYNGEGTRLFSHEDWIKVQK